MRDLRVLPEVAEDLAEAANWYDRYGYVGLGNRFLQTFRASIPHLLENGDIYRAAYSDYRTILLQPFPYFLFYRYEGDRLIVVLVIAAMRRPAGIRRLLRSREIS